ncbi:GNAT family N-acetyltransferase [Streptomyces sp. DSM 44915]|uniref:GNAT family N-acetyltransferase n=1 Tax=Streptomyces chisholmiae TaxID=3075540 RepID=A0ABU2JN26_9ACTN|nr:GNAT family N-acetyltransferase [Streptomyces sp. DSM 44915]MDT0266388.1 GNAT family N-acetyltransferase [Streptomyces sp. DSM 44915]
MNATTRAMTRADIGPVAALRTTGWRTAYRGLLPDELLDGLSPAAYAAWLAGLPSLAGHFVALDGAGAVTGWASAGAYHPEPTLDEADVPDPDGELYALYVQPDNQRSGLGRALLAESRAWLAAHGYRRLRLWVLDGNLPALAFYAAAGLAPDGGRRGERIGDRWVTELRCAGAVAAGPG